AAGVAVHARMAAEVWGRGFAVAPHGVGVLADQAVDPAPLPRPAGILPGPADGRDVGQPGGGPGAAAQILVIADLVRAPAALEDDQAERLLEPALLQVAHHGPDVADVGRDPGDGRDQEMLLVSG